tara:strand:- start:22 stop:300 length:279 start_codon:yes stop_codon:yes gene_type:complete
MPASAVDFSKTWLTVGTSSFAFACSGAGPGAGNCFSGGLDGISGFGGIGFFGFDSGFEADLTAGFVSGFASAFGTGSTAGLVGGFDAAVVSG